MVYTYDPGAFSFIIGGHIAEGFTDGSFVTVERNEDMWSLKTGCDGIGTRAKSNNRSGRYTLTLHQSSKTNDVLSALAISDEKTGTASFPVFARDGSGRTACSSLTTWVVKQPSAEFGKEVLNRVWVLESDDIEIFIGGN